MTPDVLPKTVEVKPWTEETWEEVLGYIEDRLVIPIVGPDLLQVEVDGTKTLLDRYLAQRLANEFQLPLGAEDAEPTLNHVVSRLLGPDRRERRERVYSSVFTTLKNAALAPPEALRQLAQIRDFNLFVTTTFDSLLVDALNAVRFGGKAVTQVLPDTDVKDLTDEPIELRPTVFFLMGKISRQPKYVLTEEDMLEAVCELQSEQRRPARLFETLKEKHLLILGVNFSDWLARIFLRTTKQGRLSDGRSVIEVLADRKTCHDPNLLFFLRHVSDHTLLFPCDGGGDFVAELWNRWKTKFPEELFNALTPEIPPAADMPSRAIFLSYAHEDAEAVKRLKAGLNAAGLDAWYDKERLKPGDTFHLEIENYVSRQCSCFVPLISANTESRLDSFFRREWHWAVKRDEGIHHTKSFIVPVVVDDTREPRKLDNAGRFAQLQITFLRDGVVNQDFVDRMKQITKRA
jgi:hypothetical protein